MSSNTVLDINDIGYPTKEEALASKPVSINQFRKSLRASKLVDYEDIAAICLVLVVFDGGSPCVEDNEGTLRFFNVHGLSVVENGVVEEAPDA